jgi:serine/threonine protein phosphatase PrpC
MGRITVCNVGDSRAILGHRVKEASASEGSPSEEEKYEVRSVENSLATEDEKHGTVIAVALTKDQTPYRKDERERVKKAGAVVCTIDQLEGTEPMHEDWCGADDNAVDLSGDPPRVWEKGKEYPGTAFTRSLGDSVADNCGVIAEPEMLTVELTANDEYMIIASDGVFEFLPNQYVVDLCVASKDPLEACDKIIRASYEQWLKYENRTDDITCIVLFLQCENKVDEVNIAGSTETLIGKEVKTDFKPLRLDNRERDTGGSLRYTNAEKAGLLQKLEAAPERRVQSVLKL